LRRCYPRVTGTASSAFASIREIRVKKTWRLSAFASYGGQACISRFIPFQNQFIPFGRDLDSLKLNERGFGCDVKVP
jgi:hypothetical protein